MQKRDYYEILGVDRGADGGTIKSAFRKKAGAHHPDRHPNAAEDEKKEHEEKFKEAAEAYEVLSDQEKRAAYDRFGHEGVQGAGQGFGGGGFGDMGDLFGDMFEGFFGGGGGGRGGARRGGDMRVEVELTFEEAIFGHEVEVPVQAMSTCEKCDGDGAAPGSGRKTCGTCAGQGRVRVNQGFFSIAQTCGTCRGEGQVVENPCESCHGQGLVRKKRKVKVKVPAGVDDGNQIRVRGEGEGGSQGGPPGDLYVSLEVKRHAIFERDGVNINCVVPFSFAQAALGDKIDVPTLEGTEKLKVPAGTQSGHVFRLKGRGVADLNGRGRGDQMVMVQVETPVHLSNRQKELLKEFGELSGENTDPQAANFLDKAKRLFS